MATTEAIKDVHEHGITINEHKKRVKCKYCCKEVSGFSRLKQHLGGVRGDVVPCQEVPDVVKIQMRNSLLERKNNILSREVVKLFHSEISWKENSCSKATIPTCVRHRSSQPTATKKRKKVVMNSVLKEDTMANNLFSSSVVSDSNYAVHNVKDEEVSSRSVQRRIANFFYENGIDFDAAKSLTFQKMVDTIFKCGSTGIEIPSCDELSCIYQDEMKIINHYVKEIRQSWKNTGCTILLDGWIDKTGQNVINFLVDCPQGPIFLKSVDVSGSLDNVDDMLSLLDAVIVDVGVENVIQIITYTSMGCMVAVGKLLVEKYRTIFWAVCASYCISLMLENIGMLSSMKAVLEKAKTITDFVHSDSTLLKLLKKYTQGKDLIVPSRIKSTMPFLALEKMVYENVNLQNLFRSSDWKTSKWACTAKGKGVAALVEDPLFWSDARMVLKATIPLVRSLLLIIGNKRPQMPYIYETMDQVKETIKEEYQNKKAKYLPCWQVIDEIWDNILHSPLHAAGYFLNPCLFYSSDFVADAEVASGLLCCIVRMVEDRKTQDLISLQLEEYRAAKGSFGEKMAVDQRAKVHPATWWSLYGGHCPELQKLAIRILCQTCSACEYDLNRNSWEQLHTKGSNSEEQHKFIDEMFVLHNLHLRRTHSVNGTHSGMVIEQIDQIGDEVMEEEQELSCENGDLVSTDSDEAIIQRGVASSFEPKEEPV